MEPNDMGRMLLICQQIVLERLNALTDFKYRSEKKQSSIKPDQWKNYASLNRSWKTWLKIGGEVIIGGDLLTVERIDQNKSLRSNTLSEFENLGFLGPYRIAVFPFSPDNFHFCPIWMTMLECLPSIDSWHKRPRISQTKKRRLKTRFSFMINFWSLSVKLS